MVISNEEITNNLVLYPLLEPSSLIKSAFTLAQKYSLRDESKPEK